VGTAKCIDVEPLGANAGRGIKVMVLGAIVDAPDVERPAEDRSDADGSDGHGLARTRHRLSGDSRRNAEMGWRDAFTRDTSSVDDPPTGTMGGTTWTNTWTPLTARRALAQACSGPTRRAVASPASNASGPGEPVSALNTTSAAATTSTPRPRTVGRIVSRSAAPGPSRSTAPVGDRLEEPRTETLTTPGWLSPRRQGARVRAVAARPRPTPGRPRRTRSRGAAAIGAPARERPRLGCLPG
jgi:hypothetical protein